MTTSRIDPAGLYRLKSIVRTKPNNKTHPTPQPFIDVSASTWWAGVKSGRFPKPVRNGSMTFWRGSDLLSLIESMGGGQAA